MNSYIYSKIPITDEETIKYRNQVSPFFEKLKQKKPLDEKDMKTIEGIVDEMQCQFSKESLRTNTARILLYHVTELDKCIKERIQETKDEARYKRLFEKYYNMKKKGTVGTEYESLKTQLDQLHKKLSDYH